MRPLLTPARSATSCRLTAAHRPPVRAEPLREGVLRVRLAVDEEDLPRPPAAARHAVEPCAQLAAVGVRGVAVDHLDRGAQRDLVAEDPEHRPTLDDPPPERVLRLE